MRSALPATAAAAGTALALAGCSVSVDGEWLNGGDLSGEVTSQSRAVEDFTSVRAEGDADIEIIAGDEFEVIVSADSGLQEHILTTVDDEGELLVRQDYMLWGASDDVSVTITMPECQGLDLIGAGSAYVHGYREGAFEASLVGAADLVVAADFEVFDSEILGSGDITGRGTVGDFSVMIAGSGDVRGEDLTAARAVVDVSGSGTIELRVRETLDVSISGSGDVTYWGHPTVTQSIDGSGDVSRADD